MPGDSVVDASSAGPACVVRAKSPPEPVLNIAHGSPSAKALPKPMCWNEPEKVARNGQDLERRVQPTVDPSAVDASEPKDTVAAPAGVAVRLAGRAAPPNSCGARRTEPGATTATPTPAVPALKSAVLLSMKDAGAAAAHAGAIAIAANADSAVVITSVSHEVFDPR